MNTVEQYIEGNHLQKRNDIDLIDEFEDEISQMHGNCIDIGCGPGNITRQYLLPKLPSDATVVGCDKSRKMIDYAKTTNIDQAKLSFKELDIETENLPSDQVGAYDNAVSFFCIHWCQNVRKVFENIYLLLRPNGKLLASFVQQFGWFDTILSLQENPKYAIYMKDASKYIPLFHNCENPRKKLKSILKECGFQVIHCSARDNTFSFESPKSVNQFLQGINPFTERMPANLRNEFENDALQACINTTTFFNKFSPQRHTVMYSTLIVYVVKS